MLYQSIHATEWLKGEQYRQPHRGNFSLRTLAVVFLHYLSHYYVHFILFFFLNLELCEYFLLIHILSISSALCQFPFAILSEITHHLGSKRNAVQKCPLNKSCCHHDCAFFSLDPSAVCWVQTVGQGLERRDDGADLQKKGICRA